MTVAKKARRNDGQKTNMPKKQLFVQRFLIRKNQQKSMNRNTTTYQNDNNIKMEEKDHGDRANIFQTSSRHGSDII